MHPENLAFSSSFSNEFSTTFSTEFSAEFDAIVPAGAIFAGRKNRKCRRKCAENAVEIY